MRNKLFLSAAFAAVASVSQAVLVLNHIPANMADQNNILASQDFEASNNAFDVNILEDFTVNASQTLLTEVAAMMAGFNGFTGPSQWANVTGYRVEIYTSILAGAANLTGNAGSQFFLPGAATITDPGWTVYNGTTRLISLPVSIVLPGPGTYWVGVMAVLDATAASVQVGVENNTVVAGGNNAEFVNPGGAFGFPGNHGQPVPPTNAAYRVNATVVPEPGSMIALGLGVAALAARRRRKSA